MFGTKLSENPLHLETLAVLEIKSRAALLFTLDACRYLGRTECLEESKKDNSKDALLLRILTPLLKLFTAKLAMGSASEGRNVKALPSIEEEEKKFQRLFAVFDCCGNQVWKDLVGR